ncbi:MAG: hypothetical protein V4615_08740 [Bacteroidota bacterium]
MLKSFFFFLSFTFTCCILNAQNDTTIYKVIKAVEANEYLFRVPEDWKEIPQIEASPIDEKFEFTNVGLPFKVHDAPLTAFLILRKLECDSIQTGESSAIIEFTSYPDRVAAAGETYETDSLIIASGEKATLIHSRFYRRSKVSNFSRYDLVAYSAKRTACYLLTITFQYKDPTYMVEADLKFRQYAVRILKSLVLR